MVSKGSGGSAAGQEIRNVLRLVPLVGLQAATQAAFERARNPRSLGWYGRFRDAVLDRKGLEIGGPSPLFSRKGRVPLYELLRSCDNVDFAHETLWTHRPSKNNEFAPEGQVLGHEYFIDASSLAVLPTAPFDVVLSSHVLEHLANPLKAIESWKRQLRPSGLLVAVVPEGARMFDHARPVTTVAHMVSDFERDIGDDDLGHLEEILSKHDLRMDRAAGSRAEFEQRCRNNPGNRAMHHHAFSPDSLRELEKAAGLSVEWVTRVTPFHILAVARLPK